MHANYFNGFFSLANQTCVPQEKGKAMKEKELCKGMLIIQIQRTAAERTEEKKTHVRG